MNNKTNMGIGAIIALLIAAYLGIDLQQNQTVLPDSTSVEASRQASWEPAHAVQDDIDKIYTAFQQRQSDLQVQSQGQVIALLKDDNDGSRHQRFILELSTGQTLLVAHNIDLAPPIQNIQIGDQVEFFGEYEYSEKGGVIHWTHHDPSHRHVDGWLKHQGKTYQ